jgi:hypothetical protein
MQNGTRFASFRMEAKTKFKRKRDALLWNLKTGNNYNVNENPLFSTKC